MDNIETTVTTKASLEESVEMLSLMVDNLNTMYEGLRAQISALETKISGSNRSSPGSRTMTDADAERVLGGDLADEKHKDAAEKLGLSYGQIYSARMGFTFKSVAAKLKSTGLRNKWIS